MRPASCISISDIKMSTTGHGASMGEFNGSSDEGSDATNTDDDDDDVSPPPPPVSSLTLVVRVAAAGVVRCRKDSHNARP
jgi:hypothetical protein